MKHTPEFSIDQILPSAAVKLVNQWLRDYPVPVMIAGKRKTKSGDYRRGSSHISSRITINYDINPYRTLYIFTHEMAHHMAYVNHRKNITPHGAEWKQTFFDLLEELKAYKIFPENIEKTLPGSPHQIRASSAGLPELEKSFRRFDPGDGNKLFVEDIANQTQFRIHDGRRFKKIKKRRLRYLCQSMENKRYYILSPGVEIFTEESFHYGEKTI